MIASVHMDPFVMGLWGGGRCISYPSDDGSSYFRTIRPRNFKLGTPHGGGQKPIDFKVAILDFEVPGGQEFIRQFPHVISEICSPIDFKLVARH